MRDFTITMYADLLLALKEAGYSFVTYRCYVKGVVPPGRLVILRHDIDDRPERALVMARLEHRLSVKGTYYIRNQPKAFNRAIIKNIAAMDHEIGYHYEDLSRHKGNIEKAIASFSVFLKELRTISPVHTICMHGSPLSKYDNKNLWKHFRYSDYDILAELYLDTDFNQLFYLTDTGRSWNSRFNIRDKVNSSFRHIIHDTPQLIQKIREKVLPEKMMITIHPQRWMNEWTGWLRELAFQNIKNIGKAILLYKRS